MAKKRPSRKRPAASRKARSSKSKPAIDAVPDDWPAAAPQEDEPAHPTGRMIATLLDTDKKAVQSTLRQIANATGMAATTSQVAIAGTSDNEDQLPDDVNYHVLDTLGIVILNNPNVDHVAAQSLTARHHNVVMEPELWNFQLNSRLPRDSLPIKIPVTDKFISGEGISTDYLLGMRDLIDLLLQQRTNRSMSNSASAMIDDNDTFTWGLRRTEVANSTLTGQGINVAILDSGFDVSHPDFEDRTIKTASFIPGGPDRDRNKDLTGHGTHCIGVACGPQHPDQGPRYGVACDANIFSGKVLSKTGRSPLAMGKDAWILAGINWAVANNCHVISLSLGTHGSPSVAPQSYEKAAQRALVKGSLIVAATGNTSKRSLGRIQPVSRPANCPSILAVAAVDQHNQVANFSNAKTSSSGTVGEVDLAAPGTNVRSSVPLPGKYKSLNGTSMATPHVAGLAALISQETGKTGPDLRNELLGRAGNLGNPTDLGRGLATLSNPLT